MIIRLGNTVLGLAMLVQKRFVKTICVSDEVMICFQACGELGQCMSLAPQLVGLEVAHAQPDAEHDAFHIAKANNDVQGPFFIRFTISK